MLADNGAVLPTHSLSSIAPLLGSSPTSSSCCVAPTARCAASGASDCGPGVRQQPGAEPLLASAASAIARSTPGRTISDPAPAAAVAATPALVGSCSVTSSPQRYATQLASLAATAALTGLPCGALPAREQPRSNSSALAATVAAMEAARAAGLRSGASSGPRPTAGGVGADPRGRVPLAGARKTTTSRLLARVRPARHGPAAGRQQRPKRAAGKQLRSTAEEWLRHGLEGAQGATPAGLGQGRKRSRAAGAAALEACMEAEVRTEAEARQPPGKQRRMNGEPGVLGSAPRAGSGCGSGGCPKAPLAMERICLAGGAGSDGGGEGGGLTEVVVVVPAGVGGLALLDQVQRALEAAEAGEAPAPRRGPAGTSPAAARPAAAATPPPPAAPPRAAWPPLRAGCGQHPLAEWSDSFKEGEAGAALMGCAGAAEEAADTIVHQRQAVTAATKAGRRRAEAAEAAAAAAAAGVPAARAAAEAVVRGLLQAAAASKEGPPLPRAPPLRAPPPQQQQPAAVGGEAAGGGRPSAAPKQQQVQRGTAAAPRAPGRQPQAGGRYSGGGVARGGSGGSLNWGPVRTVAAGAGGGGSGAGAQRQRLAGILGLQEGIAQRVPASAAEAAWLSSTGAGNSGNAVDQAASAPASPPAASSPIAAAADLPVTVGVTAAVGGAANNEGNPTPASNGGSGDRSGGGSGKQRYREPLVVPPSRTAAARQRHRGAIPRGGGQGAQPAVAPRPRGASPVQEAAAAAAAAVVAALPRPPAGWVLAPAGCRVRSGPQLARAASPSVASVRVHALLGMLAEAGLAAAPYLEQGEGEEPQEEGYGSGSGSGDGDGDGGGPRQAAPGQLEQEVERALRGAGRGRGVSGMLPAAAAAAASAVQALGRVPGLEHMRRLRGMAAAALPAWEVRRVLACRGLAAAAQADAVLRLAPGAPREAVRVAFRRLSLAVHPDKNRAAGAAEAFALVSAAAARLLAGRR
ncbi:hypothetical protein TSOC_005012 [Tetrabaena socialis]|uniref:J domain-containing protein n=1 Tax=Tetrabaena socialis TaxID=47790 RepID=A0A2J8A7D0_9CHLO|nr:hypothetical protein TSOC_005012 [Tetrabaena socialis]|eukprot:PNH08431.1 hypothetical protein TSOC_005012 [Tetrabaena socialis]